MPFKVGIQKCFQSNVGDIKLLLILGMWLYNSLLLLQGSNVVYAKVYQIQLPFSFDLFPLQNAQVWCTQEDYLQIKDV